MRKVYLFLATFVVLSLQNTGLAQTSQKWFTTYYATWSMLPLGASNYALPPWEMDFRGLTHVVLFDNGNVTQTAPYWAYMFNSIPADAETDSLGVEFNANAAPGDGVNRVHYLDSLVTIAHRNGVKVVITIQAVAKTTPNLNYVTADSGRTQLFVNTLVAWAERKKLDGVELDWEGWAGTPLPAVDQVDRFVRMLYRRVHTMKTYGGAPGIIMISAGSSYQNNYSASQDYMVDQYNLQLYDYAFAWQGAPANSAVAWHISPLHEGTRPANFEGESYETRGPLQWVAAGHDPKRIGLGIPTYGYILRNVNGLFQPMTNNGDYGSAHYQVIEALKNNGGVETWDDVRKVRSITGTALQTAGTVYYGSDGINAGQKFLAVGENVRSMQEKVAWMQANNFGGIMTYDFVSDLDPTQSIASNLRNPLQRAVATALGSGTTPVTNPTGTFTSSAAAVPAGGGSVTLSWTSSNATSAVIDQGVGTVALNGSTTVSVTSNKTYTLTLTSATGTVQQYPVSITVNTPAAAGTFTVSPSSLPVGGGTVSLTWTSTNTASASIDQGVGAVALNGSTTVSVTATKTFTLTLTNSAGAAVTYSVPVTVALPAAAPQTFVYDDTALTSPWSTDGSYSATFDFANKEKVLKGTTSAKIVASAWAGLLFRDGNWGSTATVNPAQYDSLHIAVYGGTAGVPLAVWVADGAGTSVGQTVTFNVPANAWLIKSIAMSQLDPANTPFSIVTLQVYQSAAATFYIDDFNLVAKAAPVTLPASPVFVYPVPLSANNPVTFSMTWTKIASATNYHVQMATDSTFKTLLINDSTLTDTVRAIAGLSNNTKYYRRVRAKNSAGWSAFCSTCQFSTILAAPGTPVLASPANGAPGQPVSVVLTWNAVTGASTYRVQVATDSLFTNKIADDSTVTAVSKTVGSLLNGTKYYWRVNAKNTGGTSAFSSFRNFATLVAAPSVPVTLSPVNGAANQPVSLSLTWSAAAGASTYRVQVATDSLFGTLLVNDSTVTSTSYAIASLSNLTPYFWRVNAKNASGTSAYSAVQKFTTAPYVKTQMYFTYTSGTGNNASVAIPSSAVFSIGGATLVNGDEIGAFTPAGICVGSVEWNGANTAITVWGDNTLTTAVDGMRSGEMIQYRVYRQAVNTVYTLVNAQYAVGIGMYQADALFQLSSLSTTTVPSKQTTQSIALSRGWNMIASTVKPNTTAIDSLTAQLAPNMTIVKNGAGLVYWPSMSVNSLGFWNFTNGYMIYMANAGTMNLTGGAIVPEATPIALSQGWNLVPYGRSSSMTVGTALAGLGSAVTVVKNNAGQIYWPAYGINTIGSLVPGQAYQMYLSQSSTLVYPANALAKTGDESSASVQNVTVHYPALAERGGANEIVLVKAAGLRDGDEIAVKTTKGYLAGTGVVKNGSAFITVWSDDVFTTDAVEGAVEGEVLSLSRWSTSDGKERSLTIAGITDGLSGSAVNNGLVFAANAVEIAQTADAADVVATSYALSQNYPNPFNPSTVIKYALPSDGMVTLQIFNALGAQVATLVNGTQHAGIHEVSFNASGLASGMYLYVIKSGSFTDSKRMMLLK